LLVAPGLHRHDGRDATCGNPLINVSTKYIFPDVP
jgi:hypothetical protein